MTQQQLCEAAVVISDNTAANLLLKATGGPQALTAWLRQMGDHQTRLDRFEPELNTAMAGDERDTTTPAAMLGSLQKLLVGPVLGEAQRNLLLQWLQASRTGGQRRKRYGQRQLDCLAHAAGQAAAGGGVPHGKPSGCGGPRCGAGAGGPGGSALVSGALK